MNASGEGLPWDWYPGVVPANARIDATAYVETTFSFSLYRSEEQPGVSMEEGASTYLGTMFDVGPKGRVRLGKFALVHGARIICDGEIDIGDYALISWNVLLMDTYRVHGNVGRRRKQLEAAAARPNRYIDSDAPCRPIRIGPNVWIGFDACVLPGVTIGEGAIVGAKAVVTENVPAYGIVAGNPARLVRRIDRDSGEVVPA